MSLYNPKTLFIQSIGFLPVGLSNPEEDSYSRSLKIVREKYVKYCKINETEAEYLVKRLRQDLQGKLYKLFNERLYKVIIYTHLVNNWLFFYLY